MHSAAPFPSVPSLQPIYMVDDDPADREIFRHVLKELALPHPLQIFASGEQLIDALISVLRGAPPPLLCFLDVKMTGMGGFDVLRWIRCQRALDDVSVVMLSSSEAPRDLSDAIYFGAQCYIAKPPTPAQIAEIVKEAEHAADASHLRTFKLNYNLLLPTAHVA